MDMYEQASVSRLVYEAVWAVARCIKGEGEDTAVNAADWISNIVANDLGMGIDTETISEYLASYPHDGFNGKPVPSCPECDGTGMGIGSALLCPECNGFGTVNGCGVPVQAAWSHLTS